MRISEIATQRPGFRLRFRPRYGWGWRSERGEAQIQYEIIDAFGAFALLATGAFKWQGEFRGLYGDIVEPTHVLFGYHFVLWSMCGGDPDLETTADSRWDLFFGRQDLRADGLGFIEPDAAGVGYGAPSISREGAEPGAPPNADGADAPPASVS